MHRRIRNTFLFAGSLVGSGLAVGGIVALMDGDQRGWLYLVAAAAAFALAFTPGRRLRERFFPPDA